MKTFTIIAQKYNEKVSGEGFLFMSLKLTIVDCDKTKSEYCAVADHKMY